MCGAALDAPGASTLCRIYLFWVIGSISQQIGSLNLEAAAQRANDTIARANYSCTKLPIAIELTAPYKVM